MDHHQLSPSDQDQDTTRTEDIAKMKLVATVILCFGSISSQRQFDSVADVSRGINQFTNLLLNDLELSSKSNFVFSPFSVHSVFSQVLFGSESRTRGQLESVLGVSSSDAAVSQYQTLFTNIQSSSAQLAVANELALARGFKPKSSYTRKLGSSFSIQEYDFVNNKQSSVQQINDGVSQRTGGLIRDLLLEEDVDELTRLLIINAIYFKAQWKTAFKPEDTFFDTFSSPVSGALNTSFMTVNTKARILTDSDNGVEILELPYADETMSMIIVLPTSEATNDISSKINNIDMAALRNMTPTDVAVTIPKFKLRYQTYLKQRMTKLGVTDLFNANANLRGITDKEALHVSEAVHQASIEVNEEGSEAAAATAVVIATRTINRRKPFFANRPFLFMIYDFQNNIPLFAGKVVDPSNQIVVQKPAPAAVTENSVNEPLQSDEKSVSSGGEPDQETCPRLLRDFPNALDNHRICEKVLEAGQYLEWLRENRNLCEASEDHFTQFSVSNCGSMFCEESRGSVVQWRLEYQQNNCKEKNNQTCKNIENKIKAYNSLGC